MTAPQGWYNAGVPGRQRWWDGAQWTAHERPVPPPVPVMGWYSEAVASDARWWDGAGWTPYRIRDGKPRTDAFAVEPGNTGILMGFVFIMLGITQWSTAQLAEGTIFSVTPVFFFIGGVLWLIGGFRNAQLRKLPPPQTAPVVDPVTRPLPGEAEGPGAGWYPVAGRVTRWWTGSQWSPYIAQKFGVRPTLNGLLGYRILMIVGWVLGGGGVLCIVLGLAAAWASGVIAATFLITLGAVGVVVGAILLPVIYVRRYTMILPPSAPPLR